MSHRYNATVFGDGTKSDREFHVVLLAGGVTVAAFDDKRDAHDEAKTRTEQMKAIGSATVYEVRPKSEGEADRYP